MKHPPHQLVALACFALLATGCATPSNNADITHNSAIALGHKAIRESVPIAGLPAHAFMGANIQEKGSYRVSSNGFCPVDNPTRVAKSFIERCESQGASINNGFCQASENSDDVLFMAKLTRRGNSDCWTLAVAEPVGSIHSNEYRNYLLGQGYVPKAQRDELLKAKQDQERKRIEDQAKRKIENDRKEQERLAIELPKMKMRGARVCKNVGDSTYIGYVEDFTDDKLRVLIQDGFLTLSPYIKSKVDAGTIWWDQYIVWRLC
ncbi:hypothetical protein [Hydrogenophaga sp. OTU3427]|uniref:hypothetical protein n=1 Tax=Hydrogenophaga sp. OTU3427 TaxID=3043856 RepID=UPI00313D206D